MLKKNVNEVNGCVFCVLQLLSVLYFFHLVDISSEFMSHAVLCNPLANSRDNFCSGMTAQSLLDTINDLAGRAICISGVT